MRRLLIIGVGLLFVTTASVNGQSQFSDVEFELQEALKERRLRQAENLLGRLQKISKSKQEQGIVLYHQGVLNFESYHFIEAIDYLSRALLDLDQPHTPPHLLGMVCFYLGRVQKDGFYDGPAALSHYAKALDYFLKAGNELWIARTYFQMARSFALSDLEQRDYYNTKALNYFNARQELYPLELAECQNLEALRVNQRDGLTPYAISLFNKAIELSLANPRTNSRVVGKYYDNLGYLQSKHDAKLGLSLLRKGLSHNLKLSQHDYWIASSYTNIASVFADLKNYDSALYYLRKALKSKQQIYSTDHQEIMFAHIHIADLFEANNQFDSAVIHYKKILSVVVDRKNPFDPYLEAYAYPAMQWMDSLLKRDSLNGSSLADVYLIAQTLDSLIQSKSIFFEYEGSQISHSRDFKEFYLKFVEVCYQLYKLTNKPEYLEKGIACMEAVRYSSLLHAYAVSKTDRGRGQVSEALHKKLAYQYALLNLAEEKQEFSKIQSVKDSIGKLHDLYKSIKKGDHVSTAIRERTFDLEDTQRIVPSDALVLEFQETTNAWYVIALTRNTRSFSKIKKDAVFSEALKKFVDINRNKPAIENYQEDKRTFSDLSSYLYQKLIEPYSALLKDRKFLYVIPDGILYELPFETLLTQQDQSSFMNFHYFGRKHTVAKAFSLKMLTASSPAAAKKIDRVLVYASTLDRLGLTNARKEAELIEDYFSISNHVDHQCSSRQFLNEAATFPAIHLALHGKQDTVNHHLSYLLFNEEDTLFAYQLYALTLQARLVVLSACESGVGKRHNGEGVFSIARAFAAAGANNIYVNMWETPDASAAELAGKFYEGMTRSGNPAEALQYSKSEFLKNKDDFLSHPYFWSGTQLIVNGFHREPLPTWLVITCILILVLTVGTAPLVFVKWRNRYVIT